MNKFWICNYCASSKSKKENKYSEPKMKRIEINGYKILVPCQDIQNNNTEIDMETLVLVPKNSQAVKIRPDNYSLNMYDLQDLDNKIISTHYQSRLSKYHQRKIHKDSCIVVAGETAHICIRWSINNEKGSLSVNFDQRRENALEWILVGSLK